jgi:hypothetical protein
MNVVIRDRRDALVWRAVDAIFDGADARTICAELELDLLRVQAEDRLTRVDRLVALMRDTDPGRTPVRKATA